MSMIICRNGKESGIREAIDYLERKYGIPSKDIRAVSVAGEVGEPILISVTVYQQEDGSPRRADVLCAGCKHSDSKHWDEIQPYAQPGCTGSEACRCDRSQQLVKQLNGRDLDHPSVTGK